MYEDDEDWDWTEYRQGMKEESQNRRKKHRDTAPEILDKHCVSWEKFNGGIHLLVFSSFDDYDFWPGTGRFKSRKTGKSGRGIFNLIKLVKA